MLGYFPIIFTRENALAKNGIYCRLESMQSIEFNLKNRRAISALFPYKMEIKCTV